MWLYDSSLLDMAWLNKHSLCFYLPLGSTAELQSSDADLWSSEQLLLDMEPIWMLASSSQTLCYLCPVSPHHSASISLLNLCGTNAGFGKRLVQFKCYINHVVKHYRWVIGLNLVWIWSTGLRGIPLLNQLNSMPLYIYISSISAPYTCSWC